MRAGVLAPEWTCSGCQGDGRSGLPSLWASRIGPAYLRNGESPLVPCTLLGPGQRADDPPPPAIVCLPLQPVILPCPPSPGTDRWKAQLSLPALLQIFGDYYHFWHRAVTKRSLSPHRLRHSRLQREPQVSAAPAPPAATSSSCSQECLSLPPPLPTPSLPYPLTGTVAGAAGG